MRRINYYVYWFFRLLKVPIIPEEFTHIFFGSVLCNSLQLKYPNLSQRINLWLLVPRPSASHLEHTFPKLCMALTLKIYTPRWNRKDYTLLCTLPNLRLTIRFQYESTCSVIKVLWIQLNNEFVGDLKSSYTVCRIRNLIYFICYTPFNDKSIENIY